MNKFSSRKIHEIQSLSVASGYFQRAVELKLGACRSHDSFSSTRKAAHGVICLPQVAGKPPG